MSVIYMPGLERRRIDMNSKQMNDEILFLILQSETEAMHKEGIISRREQEKIEKQLLAEYAPIISTLGANSTWNHVEVELIWHTRRW